eukprot:5412323-Alexandrium_andersonii.AAC.1
MHRVYGSWSKLSKKRKCMNAMPTCAACKTSLRRSPADELRTEAAERHTSSPNSESHKHSSCNM